MQTLLIASSNPGKRVEIQEILAGLPLRLLLPADIDLHLDVAETGETYAENAALKAQAFCSASGLLTLADDSGLEVDALGGQPGLHSARFSPRPGAKDADRRALLLERLAGLPRPWTAAFRCTVAIVGPDRPLRLFEGECPGQISPVERGTNGFGYDPVFWLPEYDATMAELPSETKNQISHRARALQAARPYLEELARQS